MALPEVEARWTAADWRRERDTWREEALRCKAIAEGHAKHIAKLEKRIAVLEADNKTLRGIV